VLGALCLILATFLLWGTTFQRALLLSHYYFLNLNLRYTNGPDFAEIMVASQFVDYCRQREWRVRRAKLKELLHALKTSVSANAKWRMTEVEFRIITEQLVVDLGRRAGTIEELRCVRAIEEFVEMVERT
jgi:predicted Rdx family selenoprotein